MGKNARNMLNATACACVKHEGHTRRKALHKFPQKLAIFVRPDYTELDTFDSVFLAIGCAGIDRMAIAQLADEKYVAGDACVQELLIGF
jgi:hypothetical protein